MKTLDARADLAFDPTANAVRLSDRPVLVGILAVGAVLDWLSDAHPALLPAWAPWDFSWPEYLATAFGLTWYLRGLARTVPAERPALWQRASFLFGVALIYGVLQTHFDYMAQHAFFLNRTQHVVMHHLGPFLIALGNPRDPLRLGAPNWICAFARCRPVSAVMGVIQRPLVAVLLFVGLFYFWLIPDIHFRAMIDARLYAIMNWSMVIDGLLFWLVVFDFRPKPPARLSFATRAAMAYATTFPDIIAGCYLTNVQRELYPYYSLCGRLFPSINAITDQRIGGVIMWVLPAMMAAAATCGIIVAFLNHEEKAMLAAETQRDLAR
jgi:putative membrane protein